MGCNLNREKFQVIDVSSHAPSSVVTKTVEVQLEYFKFPELDALLAASSASITEAIY
jgi:hypothetical protein